jgi:hypothetical protein
VRRTWAPKGRTPVLRHPYRRGKQISMCALLAYRHSDGDGEQVAAWMGFDLLEGAYDTRQVIRVLDGLGHQLGHQPVTVIWDNLGAHHAGDLQDWAATQAVVGACVPAVVCARVGPGGGVVGQPEGLGAGQPLLRRPRRADRHRPGRLDPGAS